MKTSYIYILIIVVVVGGLILVRNSSDSDMSATKVTVYDDFAQCLGDNGAVFYGAFWCPHCQDQKEMFDNSNKLPYVECSTPNRQGQTQICIQEEITGYPTWKFADGSVLDGVRQFDELAEKTGCELPPEA